MCGICGELRIDGGPVSAGALARMTATIAHRGPDHGATYAAPAWPPGSASGG